MVTRKQIADYCGVSISVVSRVLNGTGYVAPEKREKILKAAAELGYSRCTGLHQALEQEKKKKVLVYYCPYLDNAYNRQMYQGMLEEGRRLDYKVLVYGDMNYLKSVEYDAAGLIMPNETAARDYIERISPSFRLPVVAAGYSDGIDIPAVVPLVQVDIYEATNEALLYLEGKGHTRIGLVMPFLLNISHARTKAYESFCRGLGYKDLFRYYVGWEESMRQADVKQESFYQQGLELSESVWRMLMEEKEPPTAMLCFNDEMALGLMKGLQRKQIRIPQDLSIIGMDGIDSRKYMDPYLTSVAIFPEKMGSRCVKVLVDMIEGKKHKYVNHIKFKLSEGDSVMEKKR